MSEQSENTTLSQLTLLPEDSLVRMSVWRDCKRALTESDQVCGKNFPELFASLNRDGLWLKTLGGLFSANDGEFFGTVLRDLAAGGYDAEWQMLSASLLGAPHKRERVFIVAYSNKICGPKGMGNKSNGTPKIFRGSPEKRLDVWLQAPDGLDRVDDGIPAGFYQDAVGAFGNAVVPQVAEWIGRRIVEVQEVNP